MFVFVFVCWVFCLFVVCGGCVRECPWLLAEFCLGKAVDVLLICFLV